MYTMNHYFHLYIILQLCAYVFCGSRCIDGNYSEVHSTVTQALTDLLLEYDFTTHRYLIHDNDDFDLENTFRDSSFKFEVYESSHLSTLLQISHDRDTLVIIYGSRNVMNTVQASESSLNHLMNIVFVSFNTNASGYTSNQLGNYKILSHHPLRNNQVVLWQYIHGQRSVAGIWTQNVRWSLLNKNGARKINLQGQRLKVALLPAYKVSSRLEINGSVVYSGLYIDYLNILADNLNFTFSTVEPEDGVYGSDFDGDGQWDGIIGMAQRGEIDIGLAPFTQTVERRKAVDYLEYVSYSGLAMLMKRPDNFMRYNFLAVFKPFKPELWIAILVSIFSSSQILWRCLQLEYYIKNKNLVSSLALYRKCLRHIYKAVCAQSDIIPDNSSFFCRVFVVAIWITFIILQVTYIANLISYIAVPKDSLPANNLKELAEQNSHKIGVIKSSSHEILFRTATSGYFKQIWDKIQSDPDNLVPVNKALFKIKSEKFIFVTEYSYLSLLIAGDCELVIGQEIFLPRYLGWITPKHWPHSELFNDRITRLRESGILDVIFRKYILSHVICEERPESIQLGLQSLGGLFILFWCGCFLAFIVLIMENLYAWRMKRKERVQLTRSENEDSRNSLPIKPSYWDFVKHKSRWAPSVMKFPSFSPVDELDLKVSESSYSKNLRDRKYHRSNVDAIQ